MKWLTGLSVAVLFVILFFGLRPKGFYFSNSVSRIEDKAGIRFGKYGIAYSEPIGELRKANDFGKNGFSIEIAIKPLNQAEGFNFLFAIHNGNDRNQFLLGQWRSWIIAMNGDDYDHKRKVKRISVNTASVPPAILFFTLTTGKDGTNAYFNGQLVKSKNDLTLHIPYGNNTRLILGNSLYGKNSWRGDVYGLAVYRHILTAQDAALHFQRWSQDRNFSFARKGNPFVLYYFDEKEGTRVSDHAGGGHYLKMPPRMPILEKELLSSPWKRIKFDKMGLYDIVINILGFIPLGLTVALTLSKLGCASMKKAFYFTLFLCVAVSLIIEIAQAWMPSRSSSQLDLMCNTAGSVIGIVVAFWMSREGKRLARGAGGIRGPKAL